MITASFFVGLAACLVLAGLLYAARDAMRERSRAAMQRELAYILERVVAQDAEHATGRFAGMEVAVTVDHDVAVARVELPPAVLPYAEVLERFGGADLAARMRSLRCTMAGPNQVALIVTREAHLPDSIATLGQRLELAREIRELRRFVPGELLGRVHAARSAYEVDALLDQLTLHFPDATETRQAFEAAMARQHDKKVAQRAEAWFNARLARAAAG